MAATQKTVYVETSIFSVLVARPTKDLSATARQQTTRIWWQNDADRFDLFTSEIVHLEAMEGDAEMATHRLEYIASIPMIPVSAEAYQLADRVLASGILPAKARTDALHLAIATVHRLDFLVTWNCRHLANPEIYLRLVRDFEQIGYTPAYMCIPQGLSGVIP